MITSWLVKVVAGIAIAGLVVLELGSPWWTKARLDGVAHDAADNAAHDLFQHRTVDEAKADADGVARDAGATLAEFDVDDQGTVHVTVEGQAKSYVLRKFDQTKGWYDVKVKATAAPR